MKFLLSFLLCLSFANAGNIVSDIRLHTETNKERIVLDNTEKINFNAFLLKNPDRLVIDLQNTDHNQIKAPSFAANGIVYSIRSGRFSDTDSRLVFDLNVTPLKINFFYLKPLGENKYHRIVVDLEFTNEDMKHKDEIGEFIFREINKEEVKIVEEKKYDDKIGELISKLENEKSKNATKTKEINIKVEKTPRINWKPRIIVDAGHGGKDSGAIGVRRTQEKILTLIYATELVNTLNKTNKFDAFLTRNSDFYIELMERLSIARKRRGDMFISIHADSATNSTGRGLSIYTLSQYASDSRTAALALKENKQDIISGANLFGQYQDTINTLVDISRIKAMNDSKRFARLLEDQLKKKQIRSHGTHFRKFANFAVLTSADMPSILLEIGFLSNPTDEKMIRSNSYKNVVINSLIKAIENYFK